MLNHDCTTNTLSEEKSARRKEYGIKKCRIYQCEITRTNKFSINAQDVDNALINSALYTKKKKKKRRNKMKNKKACLAKMWGRRQKFVKFIENYISNA